VSLAGLIGGGQALRPGEIALANGGVLYLDELTEFRRDALEALRQPLESGDVAVVRLHARAVFPARFMLVASMNPCPCGWYGDPRSRCRCTPNEVRRYQAKLSGPLLDRFDLAVEVPAVDPGDLSAAAAGEGSDHVRDRVQAARVLQRSRFGPQGPASNARMGRAELERHAVLDRAATRILVDACRRLGFTARGFDRVRRVARTLADLDASPAIHERHVAEAVQYRRVVNVEPIEPGIRLTAPPPKA
jgi:magnesium chelatase family protein